MLIGVGKADITGPIAGVRFFGYGDPGQVGMGLRRRLFARAFAMDSGGRRRLVVVCEVGIVDEAIRARVLERLRERAPGWPAAGVLLVASHTHSAPGGTSSYLLYNASILGHSARALELVVSGILAAVDHALACLRAGSVELCQGPLADVSVHRSMAAYLANPEAERARYARPFEDELVGLAFRDDAGRPIGWLSWFGLHGTVFDKTNRLVDPDHSGWAARAVEEALGPGFVAAFAPGAQGDVSPNRRPTPDGRLVGEGRDARETVRLVSDKEAACALRLIAAGGRPVEIGPAQLEWIELDDLAIEGPGGLARTGAPILGQSFMAGTEDGRGPAWFEEGEGRDRLLAALSDVVFLTDEETRRRHHPKVPMLALSALGRRWVPRHLPLQWLSLPPFGLAAAPFEISSMAGRRARAWLERESGLDRVAIAGLANGYAGYLTTPEEYDLQHYEGASTLFGRDQLGAVGASWLAQVRRDGDAVERGTPPAPAPLAGPRIDDFPRSVTLGASWFGDVVEDAAPGVAAGETARATFASAHPGVGVPTSIFDVEVWDGAAWTRWADDDHPETEVSFEAFASRIWRATCAWAVGEDTPPGRYRLVHRGHWVHPDGTSRRFEGRSRPFEVHRGPASLAPAATPARALDVAELVATGVFARLTLTPGQTLVREGERSAAMWYLVRGRLRVRRRGVEIDGVHPGQVVGETGLFRRTPRLATVFAGEDAELLRLEPEGYARLRDADHPIADALERLALEGLAQRLRRLLFALARVADAPALSVRPSPTFFDRVRALVGAGSRDADAPPDFAPEERAAALERCAWLAGVGPETRERLGEAFAIRAVRAGEVLCREGDRPDEVFLVARGAVEVVVSSGEGDEATPRALARLSEGALFGWIAVVDGGLRTASCIAREPGVVLVLGATAWREWLARPGRAGAELRGATIRALVQLVGHTGEDLLALGWSGAEDFRAQVERLGIDP